MLEELLIAFAYSTRAKFAFVIGIVFFVGILAVGNHMTSNLEFNGILAPLADAIKPYIWFRYEYAAWAALISFWVQAGKIIIKERQKLF